MHRTGIMNTLAALAEILHHLKAAAAEAVGSWSEARRKLIGSWSVGIEREPKLWVLDLALRLKVQYSCTGGSCRKPVGRLSEGCIFVLRSLSPVF